MALTVLEDDVYEYSQELSKLCKEEKDLLIKNWGKTKSSFCKNCEGTGTERYCDAAGSRDYRKCKSCGGAGVLFSKERRKVDCLK